MPLQAKGDKYLAVEKNGQADFHSWQVGILNWGIKPALEIQNKQIQHQKWKELMAVCPGAQEGLSAFARLDAPGFFGVQN